MSFFENLKMALDSLKANKLRSFLTMLGIIIGVSSVITIVSLGHGGQKAITGEFEKIGAATINIKVNGMKAQKIDYITEEDIKNIREKVETVKYITPMVQKSGGVAVTSKSTKRAFIMGGNTDILFLQNLEITYGRFYTEKEFEEGKAVVVIDEDAAKALFGYVDVVGKTLMVGKKSSPMKATIVGVTKGYTGPFAGMDDNMPALLVVPLTYLSTLYSEDLSIDTLSLIATFQDNGEQAGNSAISLLESRHNNRGKDIYKAENALKQLEEINKVLAIFTAFIGAVAAISLLVGGIGVMNIMLVSVTERTREIGIRKAIGATTGVIMLQFLTESVIISVLAGVIGMFIGIIGAEIIGLFAKITPSISIDVILGTILFSSAVGIFFGIYPARKAAKLDPIDALRYE